MAGRKKISSLYLVLPAALLASLLWIAFALLIRGSTTTSLPELPDLTGQPPALAAHLRQADLAARNHPSSAKAAGALGMAYHSDLFNREAEACYARAVELDPRNWRWRYYETLLQEEIGAVEPVAAKLEEVVELNPDFAPAWFRLGEAAFKLGRYDESERAYRQAAGLPPPRGGVGGETGNKTFPIAAYATRGLARLAIQRRDLEQAKRLLEGLTRSHPAFGPAHRHLGLVYQMLHQRESAGRSTAMAARCAPYIPPADPLVDALCEESRSSTFLLKHAALAGYSLNPNRALTLLQRAVEVNGEDADALLQLSLKLLSYRRPDEAISPVKKYLGLSRDYKGMNKLATELFRAGKAQEAIQCIRKALEINPDYAHSYNNLGCIFENLGQIQIAMDCFRKAIQIQPEFATPHSNLGHLLLLKGELGPASRHLEKAIQIDENHADAHNFLGMVLVQLGERDRARQQFQRALELRPNFPLARKNLQSLLDGK